MSASLPPEAAVAAELLLMWHWVAGVQSPRLAFCFGKVFILLGHRAISSPWELGSREPPLVLWGTPAADQSPGV